MIYKDWMESQDKDFIFEVNGNQQIPNKFKDLNKKDVNLDGLKELDDKYINVEDNNE